MKLGSSGQALAEACAGLALIVLFFAVAVPGLVARWNQFRCLRAAFEKTHRVLVGAPAGFGEFAVEIVETEIGGESRVIGRAICGGRPTEVRLRGI